MTADLLSSLAAILLSLFAAYFPGFSPWYGSLPSDSKRLLMLLLLLLAAGGSFALTCAGFGAELGSANGGPQTCDTPGAVAITRLFISALIANQSTYALAVRGRS